MSVCQFVCLLLPCLFLWVSGAKVVPVGWSGLFLWISGAKVVPVGSGLFLWISGAKVPVGNGPALQGFP